MSEELQELMNSNPEWYKNLLYVDVKGFIRANINSAARSFIAIGYYLKYVRDNELHIEDGYNTIWEFAKGEFGIGKSSASQYMSINDKFSKDSNSPVLLEKYKDFSSSKLSEMLTMTEEQLEEITPATTIVEIRQIKKPIEIIPEEVVVETVLTSEQMISGKCIHRAEFPCTLTEASKLANSEGIDCAASCCWNCSKRGTCGYQCNSSAHRPDDEVTTEPKTVKPEVGTYIYDVGRNGEISKYKVISKECNFSEKYFVVIHEKSGTTFNISSESEHWHYSREEAKCDSWYDGKIKTVNDFPEIVNDEPEIVDNKAEFENDVDESVTVTHGVLETDHCIKCKWYDVSPEDIPAGEALSCLDCDETTDMFELINSDNKTKPEEVETIEADIIQTEYNEVGIGKEAGIEEVIRCTPTRNQDDPECPAGMGPKRGGCTRSFTESFDEGNYICKCCWDSYLRRLISEDRDMKEPLEIEILKIKQPELPILKNNDQRTEWLKDYKSWGIWYHDERINVTYYRYDFDNNSYIVVDEYTTWDTYNRKERASGYYHLVGRVFNSQGDKTRYSHYDSSLSEIVEYLKDIQKKGGTNGKS